MFHDLDATLKALLDDAAAPAKVVAADKSFETPEKTYAPGQLTLNLFLYDVAENRELRDPVPIIEKKDNAFITRRPPLRVGCSYLVTAWSSQGGANKVAEEHQLLADAFGWLSRFPSIPGDYFVGSLVGQPFPPPSMVAQMDGNKAFGEFWTAMGHAPRPGFRLAVTIAMDVSAPTGGFLVSTRSISAGPGTGGPDERLAVSGQVLDGAGKPVAGAQVHVIGTASRAVTDEDGRYLLENVGPGSEIEVVATGFTPQSRPLAAVPARPEDYSFKLVPL
jgi:hypothetical protein